MDRHDGDSADARNELRTEADWHLAALDRSFPQADGRIRLDLPSDEEGWYISSEPDARTTEITYQVVGGYDSGYAYDGPSLSTKGVKAREHVAAARHAHETAERVKHLTSIRNGREAAWFFLPATHRQEQRAANLEDGARRTFADVRTRTRLRREFERARDTAAPYEGMGEEEIRSAARAEYREVEVRSWTGRVGKGYVHGSGISADGSRTLPAVHEMHFDDELDNAVGSVLRARARRKELAGRVADFPSAEEDERTLADAEATAEQYRRYKGWPGGDIGPQQDSDGKWHHLVPGETIRDDRWEELPLR